MKIKDGQKAQIDPCTGNPMYDDSGELLTEPVPKESLAKAAPSKVKKASADESPSKAKAGKKKGTHS